MDKSTVVTVFTDLQILEDAPCLINTIKHKYKSHPLKGFIRSRVTGAEEVVAGTVADP